ncbi:MAG: single-stranded DNA-binding protein [Candidatus Merdivicinus sp.]|jgi:single-strand DNA-binding protein
MLNRVILMGRLVADPELRQTTSGISVATFRVAVDRNFQAKGSTEKQADFIPCVAWRQTADFISRYFSKGRMIALEGSLQSRSYEDKTGTKRTAYEVIVDQAYFADSKPNGGTVSDRANIPFPTEPPHFEEPPKGNTLSVGDFGSFEEVDTDDGDLPF